MSVFLTRKGLIRKGTGYICSCLEAVRADFSKVWDLGILGRMGGLPLGLIFNLMVFAGEKSEKNFFV